MNRKKIIAITFIFMLIVLISSSILAATIDTSSIKNNKNLGEADNSITTIGNRIFTGVSNVGMALSVVVIAVIGVKYMLGSVEERAEYKKSLVPYLIAAILIFSASTIGKIIYDIFSNIK